MRPPAGPAGRERTTGLAPAPRPERRARHTRASTTERDRAWSFLPGCACRWPAYGASKRHWTTRGLARRRGAARPRHRRAGRIDAPGLHVGQEPVADIVDAELAVIDLAVLGAAFLGGKNLDVLALRAKLIVEVIRFRVQDDAVVLAVQHEEGAFDLLRDAVERELLRPFERGLVVRGADHPAELKDRGGARARIDREPRLVAGDPLVDA